MNLHKGGWKSNSILCHHEGDISIRLELEVASPGHNTVQFLQHTPAPQQVVQSHDRVKAWTPLPCYGMLCLCASVHDTFKAVLKGTVTSSKHVHCNVLAIRCAGCSITDTNLAPARLNCALNSSVD